MLYSEKRKLGLHLKFAFQPVQLYALKSYKEQSKPKTVRCLNE